jgi:hypothetical protein
MGDRSSGRVGAELDQVAGPSAAGEDLKMPKVLDNIIGGVVADPKTYSVIVTWANGERTVE